jgi:hypothetical protein
MQITLWAHPAAGSAAVKGIVASVDRLSPTLLRFRWEVSGHIEEIIVPEPGPAIRSNNLWQSTCFEAFLSCEGHPGYLELNFSPSSRWAAYDFSAYRDGMVQANLAAPPDITMKRDSGHLDMAATVSLDAAAEDCRLNLCAVIEERGGGKSYWAAHHQGAEPDFHRQDCFGVELPAPKRS